MSDIISSPGKFQGEPTWAPHFWNLGLEGCARDDIDNVWVFEVEAGDKRLFPALEGVCFVALREDDQGFVRSRTFASEAEVQTFVDALESEYRDGEEG